MTAIRPRRKIFMFWTLSILLGVLFLFAGATKLLGAQMQVEGFTRLGLPNWTRPVVGLVEVVAAVMLLVPRTRFYGAGVLAGTMVGAMLTHLVSGVDIHMVGVNFVLLALSAVIAWSHRPDILRHSAPTKAVA